MNSRTVPSFWKLFYRLPLHIQRQTYQTYRRWRTNPSANSLRFKRVSDTEPVYSVRIGSGYRALGLLEGDTIYWYFIGNHDEYERQLSGS